MKVLRFSCEELNSFITKELTFFPDVSFLHGINGSGKTTILRAIASILTPDPIWLANASFKEIVVEFEHQNQIFNISIEKGSQSIIGLRISGGINLEGTVIADDIRLAAKLSDEDYSRLGTDTEDVNVRVRNLVDASPIFSFISNLPTPIFLGLDRTTLTPSISRNLRIVGRGRVLHPYFRTQLDDAIVEAERLVSKRLSRLSSERNRIFEQLRNQFVLSLFAMPKSTASFDAHNFAKFGDQCKRMRKSVLAALQKIHISQEEISGTVEPFFKEIERLAGVAERAEKSFSSSDRTPDDVSKFVKAVEPFINFIPSISIIERSLVHVEDANRREKALMSPVDSYLSILDGFFSDSGKRLVFEENTIRVRLPSGELGNLTSLSSGERQVFVLLTHLVFNPAIQGENVLLIDEPELSLHLKWQRQFVAAILEASPSTQMILATHSPEIVYDRDDRLISLSAS